MSVWWCFRITSLKYNLEINECLWLEDTRNLSQAVRVLLFFLLKTEEICEWTENVLNPVVEKEETMVKNRQLHGRPCYRLLNPVVLWMQGCCGSVSPGSDIREVDSVFLIGISTNQHRQKAVSYQHTHKHATPPQNTAQTACSSSLPDQDQSLLVEYTHTRIYIFIYGIKMLDCSRSCA